ncbi:MAG: helix-turn-helix domain-containing protein [Bacteroidales bacterium]|nr:helix-turn-helix domain-containing protein [Bacteroidales bacterium]
MQKNRNQLISRTIYIKNMVCFCCIQLIRERLDRAGIEVEEISPGKATISYDEQAISNDDIRRVLNDIGTDIIEGRDKILVEQIKQAIIELIHLMNNMDSIIRKSDYLVEKTGLSYAYLSRIFSSQEHITLEKYIILNKIERIKELIDQDEFTLSEIAFMMDYSSVQYLSNQFKQITGMTVSDYKDSDRSSKKSIDKLY